MRDNQSREHKQALKDRALIIVKLLQQTWGMPCDIAYYMRQSAYWCTWQSLTTHEVLLTTFFFLRQGCISYFPCHHDKNTWPKHKTWKKEGSKVAQRVRVLPARPTIPGTQSRERTNSPLVLWPPRAYGALRCDTVPGETKQTSTHFTTKVQLGKPLSLLGLLHIIVDVSKAATTFVTDCPLQPGLVKRSAWLAGSWMDWKVSSAAFTAHITLERAGPCVVGQFWGLLRLNKLFTFWVFISFFFLEFPESCQACSLIPGLRRQRQVALWVQGQPGPQTEL